MIGALVSRNHAAIVIRHGKTQGGNSQAIEPQANFHLHVPFGIPLRQHHHRGTRFAHRKKARVHPIILRPRRIYRAREGQDAVAMPAILRTRVICVARAAIFGRMQDVIGGGLCVKPGSLCATVCSAQLPRAELGIRSGRCRLIRRARAPTRTGARGDYRPSVHRRCS